MIASLLFAAISLGLTVLFAHIWRHDGAKIRAALQGRSLKAAGQHAPVAVTVRWLPRAGASPAPSAANLNRGRAGLRAAA